MRLWILTVHGIQVANVMPCHTSNMRASIGLGTSGFNFTCIWLSQMVSGPLFSFHWSYPLLNFPYYSKMPLWWKSCYPFIYIQTQLVFLRYLAKFQSVTNVRTFGFWTFISKNLRQRLSFLVPSFDWELEKMTSYSQKYHTRWNYNNKCKKLHYYIGESFCFSLCKLLRVMQYFKSECFMFHWGFQTRENWNFYCFHSLETPMKHKAQVF